MNTKAEKRRIVIVDDHPMLREHVARVINKEADMVVVGEADNVQLALQVIQETKPDLAMVDLSLYDENGLKLAEKLKALSIPVPILVLTMHEEPIRAERAFRAGAQGYITKHQSSHVMITAIRQILSGQMYISGDMMDVVLSKLVPAGTNNIKHSSVERLTERELMILEMIGHGQSSRGITKALNISKGTVATYRGRIRKKLNLADQTQVRQFAIKWLSKLG